MSAQYFDSSHGREFLESLHVTWPEKPDGFSEPLIELLEYQEDTQTEILHSLPPPYPTRTITEYDEYGVEFWSELTSEEWEAAVTAYETAREAWNKTNGMLVRKTGPNIVTAKFGTVNGSWAKGVYVDGKWHWLEEKYSSRGRAYGGSDERSR